METEKNVLSIANGYIILYRDLTCPDISVEHYYDLNTAINVACYESNFYDNAVVSVYKLSLQNDLRHIASFYHGKTFEIANVC